MLVHEFDPALLGGARLLAREHGASLFMVLGTAFSAVLARHSGQDDFTVGTTMLGRMRPELERVVGLFVNMVALRCDASGDPTFAGLLDRMRDVTLGAYDHQEVPFEQVVGRVERRRDPSRNPLFQVGMQVLSDQTGGGTLDLVGVDAEAALLSPGGARFDLSMTYTETADRLSVSVEYATDLFDRWRVEQIVTHIERALAAAVADPGTRLSQLPLVSTTDHDRLVTWGCGEDLAYRREPVHTVVAEQARLRPDAVAAVYEDQQLTYRELHRRARLLASHLRRLGVGHQDVVAVASERDLDTLVALIGVLQAGAAFTVLEPSHPDKRLRFILSDTAAKVVVTNAAVLASLPEPDGWVPVCLDRDWPSIAAPTGEEDWAEWCTGDSLAYVLYTSGSTGNPKGVLIEHRALMLYVASFTRLFDLTPADHLLQYASLVFDLAEAEIFSALTVGATLVLGSRDTLMSPEALADLVRRERVTYLGAPPAMLALLEAEPYPDLRGVLAGGEAFSGDLVNRWNLPGRRFVNGYGPTETTIGCTAYVCPHAEWRSSPPIGPPLPHRRLYVVDRDGGLAPVGVPGELLIGGDEGLARGYLNQPELTAERFVPDPFRPQGRVYHSGDLVRWRPDGLLEFIGRIDNQVKLRGLRIELEEIEAVICRHRAVDQCVVVVREDRPGDSQLVAYLVAGDSPPSVGDLRAHVGLELPAYMIPSAWVTLDALPLAVSGKVDRANLPAPAGGAERSRTPLRTPTEEAVGAICAEILGVPAVGADDNFFELGGTSLQAIRLVSRLTDQFGTTVTVRTVYGGSTISALAAQLDELMGASGSSAPPRVRRRGAARASSNGHGRGDAAVSPAPAWSPLVPLSAGDGAPLYCVHSVSGSVFSFAGLARLLGGDHPLVAIEASGVSGGPPLEVGLDELAATYVQAVDGEHPGEPAVLMGWSMGGVVAFAMASQLEAAGRRPPLVVLVDAPVPSGAGAPGDHECLTQFARDLAEATGRAAPTLPPPPPEGHVGVDGVDHDLLRHGGRRPARRGAGPARARRRDPAHPLPGVPGQHARPVRLPARPPLRRAGDPRARRAVPVRRRRLGAVRGHRGRRHDRRARRPGHPLHDLERREPAGAGRGHRPAPGDDRRSRSRGRSPRSPGGHAMESVDVQSVSQVLVAGDTPNDLRAGANAGVRYVARR